jgi:hypothetical protein
MAVLMRVSMVMIIVMMMLCMGMRMRSLFCWFSILEHAHAGGRDTTAIYRTNCERSSEIQCGHGFVKHVGGNATANQGSEKHIATDTGKAVKISNAHGSYCFTVAEVMADAGRTSFIEPER